MRIPSRGTEWARFDGGRLRGEALGGGGAGGGPARRNALCCLALGGRLGRAWPSRQAQPVSAFQLMVPLSQVNVGAPVASESAVVAWNVPRAVLFVTRPCRS